jgi:D-alanyl-D-alanine carboxypeptidase
MLIVVTLATLALPARANPLLLVDMDTLEVLHAEEAGQPWHPASLTKLMTAFVAFEQIALGKVSLDTPVTLSRNAISQPPSKSGLPVDSALSLKDALYVLMVKSANDVAVGIAETVGGSESAFIGMMNDAARRMGLSATRFVNPHGLHDPAQVTSARDLGILSLYILQTYPQYAPMFATETVTLGQHRYESQNALLTGFAGTTGMKTGYVCASGLNIVTTVERNGRRLLAVVLGASSGRERNERAAELMLRALSGSVRGTGQGLLTLANASNAAPVDMRPLICGAQAKEYVAAREAEFPMGLEGQPSYLNDAIPASSYAATDLGRIRMGVPLPRPRPAHMPSVARIDNPLIGEPVGASDSGMAAISGTMAPMPRPRPNF